jgi:peptidyl-prolyl cis-trans isomerase SurA
MKIKYFFTGLIAYLFAVTMGHTQENEPVIDKVVAVVGNNIVKLSDIENQFLQAKAQGVTSPTGDLKCDVFEELLTQKLFLNQARIDSVEVTETEVEMQLAQRMNYFINQIGSQERLEEYFNKSMIEIKNDFRDPVREQLLTDKMQREVIGEINVTPSEVKKFYNSLPEDSIPFIESKIQYRQVMLYPPHNEEAVLDVKERLLELRQRILNGESFSTLAVLYSEGPSATQGGELGYMSRGSLDPAYAKAAFSLKEGGVSKIVETDFGFHIIQLIDRRDDKVNTRHIIMKPKVSAQDMEQALSRLDSIATLIENDSLSFKMAARYFSEDENTYLNGGIVINQNQQSMNFGSANFHMDDLRPTEFNVIRNLEVEEMSEPFKSRDDKDKQVLKIVKLISKTDPHVANLEQDYNLLKNMAKQMKQQELIQNWIADKIKSTYISIDNSYGNCSFSMKGWNKNDLVGEKK